jgi:hypothetical protein
MLKEEKLKIQVLVQASILAEEYHLQIKILFMDNCNLQDKKLKSSYYLYKPQNYR